MISCVIWVENQGCNVPRYGGCNVGRLEAQRQAFWAQRFRNGNPVDFRDRDSSGEIGLDRGLNLRESVPFRPNTVAKGHRCYDSLSSSLF
jgi:hypothetical protein